MTTTKKLKATFSSSLSAEKIGNNDDLLLQILTHLPIKSLLQFKSVSKHWRSVITNPNFTRRGYLPHSPCICGLFMSTWSSAANQFQFINLNCKHKHSDPPNSVNYPPETIIIASCKGLLLCSSVLSTRSEYSVCNPTTKQKAILPPLLTQAGEISGPVLAFDQLKSPHYKVICLRQIEVTDRDLRIEVYSSEFGEWRLSEATLRLDLGIGIHGGVFWNDGIHWYTDLGPCFYFDVDEEQFKEMAMPNPIPDNWKIRRVRYFKESGGHLQLTEIYNSPSTQFDVWEMEKDRSGWLLKYKVNLDGLVSEFPGIIRRYFDPTQLNYYVFEILCIVEAGEGEGEGESEDDSYMVLHIPASIVQYNLKTRSFKKLCDFPGSSDHQRDEDSASFYYSRAHQYIESLISV